MKRIEETQYRLALLGEGLQGLGLSLSIHNNSNNVGITDLHAQYLAHLVECCGFLASHLADRLEDQIADQPKSPDDDSEEDDAEPDLAALAAAATSRTSLQ